MHEATNKQWDQIVALLSKVRLDSSDLEPILSASLADQAVNLYFSKKLTKTLPKPKLK